MLHPPAYWNGRVIFGSCDGVLYCVDALTGGNPRVVSRLEAGMEMFLEPDDKPSSGGPELFSHERAKTITFKRHQGRVYFHTSDRHIALLDGRLFCSRDPQALDRIVDLMNKEPKSSGKIRDVMQVPVDDSIL